MPGVPGNAGDLTILDMNDNAAVAVAGLADTTYFFLHDYPFLELISIVHSGGDTGKGWDN